MVERIYSNAVLLIILAAATSVVFSAAVGYGAHAGLQKAAFIFGTTLAGGFFSVAMTFATKGRAPAESLPEIPTDDPADGEVLDGEVSVLTVAPAADAETWSRLDLNVLVSAAAAITVLAGLITYVDVTVFTDMVAEGLAGGFAGSIAGIITTFAKRDSA